MMTQYRKFCLYGFLKNLKFFDPFLILYFREAGLSFFAIGTLYSIREISTNIMEIPSGIIADIVGRRLSMVFSFFAYILSFIIFYLFPSYITAIPAMILFSIGEAFRTGTHKAIILTYLKQNNMLDQKIRYYGRTRSWSQIGSAVSALIAAFIVFYSSSYRIVFLFSMFPYIAGLFLIISYPKELDSTGKHDKETAGSMFKQFIKMISRPEMFKPVLRLSIVHGSFKSIKDYIQPAIVLLAVSLPILGILSEKEKTSIFTGVIYFFLFLLTSAASRNSFRFSRKSSKIPFRLFLLFSTFGAAIILLGIIEFIPFVMIIVFIFLYILMNIIRPMQIGLMADIIEPKLFASGLSVESQATSLMAAVIAPVFGLMVDKISLSWAFIILGITIIFFSLLFSIKKKIR